MSHTNTQEEYYHDIPALLCLNCGNVSIKGGITWEKECPSNEMCNCTRDYMVGDKRKISYEDKRPSKRFSSNLQH